MPVLCALAMHLHYDLSELFSILELKILSAGPEVCERIWEEFGLFDPREIPHIIKQSI